jgi:uncharacterized coiled-coil protein SlyX
MTDELREKLRHVAGTIAVVGFLLILASLVVGMIEQPDYFIQSRPAPRIATIMALFALIFAIGGSVAYKRLQPVSNIPPLEARIGELTSSLRESNEIIEEINAEIDTQKAALDRIREERAVDQPLAEATRAEAEAVKAVVDTAVKHAQSEAGKSSRRRDRMNIALGFFLGIAAGVIGNYAYAFLT